MLHQSRLKLPLCPRWPPTPKGRVQLGPVQKGMRAEFVPFFTLSHALARTLFLIWLLAPELLRLGAWDLVCAWSQDAGGASVDPRLAMHVVNESALCFNVRKRHGLSQKGFELASGLPFVPTDAAIHDLLGARDMTELGAATCAWKAAAGQRPLPGPSTPTTCAVTANGRPAVIATTAARRP